MQKTIPQLADEYGVHPTRISNWKKQFLENISSVFENKENNAEKTYQKARITIQLVSESQKTSVFVKEHFSRGS